MLGDHAEPSSEFPADIYSPNFHRRSVALRDPTSDRCDVNSDCSSGSLCCEVFLDTASKKTGSCYDPSTQICCSFDGSVVPLNALKNFTGQCCTFSSSKNQLVFCPQGSTCGDGGGNCHSGCSSSGSGCGATDSCCQSPTVLAGQGSGTCYNRLSDVCCFDGRICNSSVCTVPEGGQCCAVNVSSGLFTFCGAGTKCGLYENTVHCLNATAAAGGTVTNDTVTDPSQAYANPDSHSGFISTKSSIALILGITIPVIVFAIVVVVVSVWLIRKKHFTGDKIVQPNIPPAYKGPSAVPFMAPGSLSSGSGSGSGSGGSGGSVIPPGYFDGKDMRYVAMAANAFAMSDIDSHSAVPWTEIEMTKSIGQGSFGEVYKARWHAADVAVKKIHPELLSNAEAVDNFYRESEILKKIKPHPNTVLFFGITKEPVGLIMEYCENGSLYQYLHSSVEIPIATKRKFLLGIAKGMVHLHYYNIIHRDLAARNILLTDSFCVKVSDFGFSQVMKLENHIRTPVGPVNWYPPEALRENMFSLMTDSWSFGVVVWEVVTRKDPFNDKASSDVITGVSNGNLTLAIPSDCPSDLARLMRMCFKQLPNERPSFEEIVAFLEAEQSYVTA